LEADDERSAAGRLQIMNCIPIQIVEATGQNGSVKKGLFQGVSGKNALSILSRVSTRDILRFSQDLSGLLKAGLPVDRALSILSEVSENRKLQAIIKDVLKLVQSGSYLSDAMARHPEAFSNFYINMIRAGEAGGVLEPVLERLGIFLENRQELKDYIISAMVYPAFLMTVSGLSIIILMTFVIPKFAVIFADMGEAIPLSTKILLNISEMLRYYWWALLMACTGGIVIFQRYQKSSSGRRRVDNMKIKMPLLGQLFVKIEVARFARTLGTLVKSGVPILQALELVRAIAGNIIFSQAMKQVHDRVKEGDRISKPMTETGVFPLLAVQMITVGEESGTLDDMLLRVADQYEKTVRNLVKRFIRLLEPALILLMGLMVGFIVISMLMAIFSVNDMPF